MTGRREVRLSDSVAQADDCSSNTDMPLKDDLIRKGYLPENVAPAFSLERIADFFDENEGQAYLSNAKRPVRPAAYNASKRGMTRRIFAMVHPVTAHDLAKFVSIRWEEASDFFAQSRFSLSAPRQSDERDRWAATSEGWRVSRRAP